MPPKKRARVATVKPKQKSAPTRRSTRRTAQDDDQLPGVYQEMLADLPEDERLDEPPAKRRKTAPESDIIENSLNPTRTAPISELMTDDLEDNNPAHEGLTGLFSSEVSPFAIESSSTPLQIPRHQQVIFDDSASDSDDSEVFEDVEINPVESATGPSSASILANRNLEPVTISFNGPLKSLPRRKRITKADRLHRLAVHKWHYLCLLLHMVTVNQWCNDAEVQASLKKIIPRKLISRLHHEGTQAERKFAFDNSMIEIRNIWNTSFKITEPGARRARWRDLEALDLADEMDQAPEPIDFEDFKEHAKAGKRRGTRDLGAQLFCALCRALAIDARLICSLQVLPFTMAASKGATRSSGNWIQAGEQDFGTNRSADGQSFRTDSERPIWWVEVLNPAVDQWIPVDARRLGSYNQPRTKFEPSASDSLNSMSYVVALEENGAARDVTKRYTSAYNAKTRRLRVENTKDGEEWISKVMFYFAKHHPEPRDQIEDAELNRRVTLEGMPKSVQDFKDHPVYVLERHLRSTEVIEPKKECGRLKVGRDKVEIVYRREHVHACRTADGWYRRGRTVSDGMQPLRHVTKRRALLAEDDEDEPFAALYAEYQTKIYVPPEVTDGRVPRNAFGNLDVYVPTMIPMGGVHVRHPFAAKAAQVLGIDHVEAVIGFKFQGRQGTAVMDGIVVASQYLSILTEVISVIEDEAIDETTEATDAVLERLWTVMFRNLRIRQVVQQEYGDNHTPKSSIRAGSEEDREDEEGLEDNDVDDEEDLTYEDTDDGGGFTVEAGEATAETRAEEAAQLSNLKDNRPVTLPTPIARQKIIAILSPHRSVPAPSIPQEESFNDLFDEVPDFTETSPHDSSRAQEWQGMTRDDDVEGGGFVTTPQDSSGSWDSGLASNMQDAVPGGRYTDDMMNPSDLPIRDYIPETTPSPYPNATLECPDMAVPSRENRASANNVRGDQQHNMADIEDGSEVAETESLLSHDPEDDDTEPEWVAAAFDDG